LAFHESAAAASMMPALRSINRNVRHKSFMTLPIFFFFLKDVLYDKWHSCRCCLSGQAAPKPLPIQRFPHSAAFGVYVAKLTFAKNCVAYYLVNVGYAFYTHYSTVANLFLYAFQ